jgi:hypothetical protein
MNVADAHVEFCKTEYQKLVVKLYDRSKFLQHKTTEMISIFWLHLLVLWDVGIHCDNHVEFHGSPAKTVPSRVRLLYTGWCVLLSG